MHRSCWPAQFFSRVGAAHRAKHVAECTSYCNCPPTIKTFALCHMLERCVDLGARSAYPNYYSLARQTIVGGKVMSRIGVILVSLLSLLSSGSGMNLTCVHHPASCDLPCSESCPHHGTSCPCRRALNAEATSAVQQVRSIATPRRSDIATALVDLSKPILTAWQPIDVSGRALRVLLCRLLI